MLGERVEYPEGTQVVAGEDGGHGAGGARPRFRVGSAPRLVGRMVSARPPEGAGHLARVLREETGMRLVFHPHAESHVETDEQVRRFLADTDPERVGLCLDTGHVAYTRGNAPPLIREHAGRIWYVHLKAVDPGVLARVEAERLSFADAVRRDVMCEPGLGVPDLDDLAAALGSLPAGTFVIVEQDLYPCDFDRPYPIAARTRKTLRAAGIG